MGRSCHSCNHPLVEALQDRFVAGVPFRKIARECGPSLSSVFRHCQGRHYERKRGLPIVALTPSARAWLRRAQVPGPSTPPESGPVIYDAWAVYEDSLRREGWLPPKR